MFPFGKIFKQASALTKTNRFLWVYGLFLVLFPITWVYAFWAKSGMVVAIKEIIDKKNTNFVSSLKTGNKFFGSVFITGLLFAIVLGAMTRFTFQPDYMNFFTALVYLIVALGLIVVTEISILFIILNNLKLKDAFKAGTNLLVKYWLTLSLLALVLIVINCVFPSLALIVFLKFYGNILLAFVALFFLLLGSIPMVFTQICWIKAFQELVKPIKLEEGTEAAILPEIVS